MVSSIALTPYVVRVRSKQSRDYLRLDRKFSTHSFITIFEAYLKHRKSRPFVHEGSETAIKLERLEKSGQHFYGILQSGDYGYEAELENLETGAIRRRDRLDCEYLPFFFVNEFRRGQNEAILLLQRFGVFGVKTVFERDLQQFIDDKWGDYVVTLNPLVTQQAINEALGGGIKKIRFTKNKVPADVADDLELDDNVEEEGTMELIIKPRRRHWFRLTSWMKDIVNGRVDAGDLLEISGVEYDDVKLEVSLYGHRKTLQLSDLKDRFRTSIEVSQRVVVGTNGHPEFDSIRSVAFSEIPALRMALGWSNAK